MTSVPRKITLHYSLTVPITFQDFVEFVNKERDEEHQLTTQDALAKDIWKVFVGWMKEKDKKIPSGRDVNINDEPDHESVYIIRDLVEDAIKEVEDSDDEDDTEGSEN